MNNPIKIFNEIFDAYFKYINSGLPFCREEYNQERNALIQETGTICQPPIIEIVPKYHEKASLKEFCINEGVSEELNDFVSTGLFVNNSKQERRPCCRIQQMGNIKEKSHENHDSLSSQCFG